MEQLKSLARNPFNWIILAISIVLIYLFSGYIIKVVVSILLIVIAYWISKFTGPYMRRHALRNTIDDMITRRTNWDGTLKQANQMYEINKVSGYFMPYVCAIIFIVCIWTAKDDDTNSRKVNSHHEIETVDVEGAQDVINELSIDNSDEGAKIVDIKATDCNFNEGFPTPEYIYKGLLNPDTRNFDSFYLSLIKNGFEHVELQEYVKESTGSIYFEPGASQDVVYISLYYIEQREKFENSVSSYFKNIPNCSVDFSGDGTIIITVDY